MNIIKSLSKFDIGQSVVINNGYVLAIEGPEGTDETIKITPPLDLTLEKAMGLMRADEYLEVTPNAIRLRKDFLKESDRAKHNRKK